MGTWSVYGMGAVMGAWSIYGMGTVTGRVMGTWLIRTVYVIGAITSCTRAIAFFFIFTPIPLPKIHSFKLSQSICGIAGVGAMSHLFLLYL